MPGPGDIVALADGEAQIIANGVCVVSQKAPEGTVDVVLRRSDLEALLAAM